MSTADVNREGGEVSNSVNTAKGTKTENFHPQL